MLAWILLKKYMMGLASLMLMQSMQWQANETAAGSRPLTAKHNCEQPYQGQYPTLPAGDEVAKQQQCHCAGGLSFSFLGPISGAFDSVPRRLLAQSLFRLGADPDVIHILMAFHHQAQYWSTVAGHRSAVATTQASSRDAKLHHFCLSRSL